MSNNSIYQLALSRIQEEENQEKLAEIFSYYYEELLDILAYATIENAGIRPESLSNEVFSSFHHIARGLCFKDATVENEFDSALKSHLKRATLDSYKIAINSHLKEEEKTRELLDYLVLAEDFSRYIPEGLEKINEIKDSARKIKNLYLQAKKYESHGDFDYSIIEFNKSLEESNRLRSLLEVFTKDRTYTLACAREANAQRERQKDRKFTFKMVILTAVLTAILSTTATYYVPKILDNYQNQDKPVSDVDGC